MKYRPILLVLIFCFSTFFAYGGSPFVVGEIVSIESSVLGKKATINIKLPSSYQALKNKKYPVYYGLSTDGGFVSTAGVIDTLSHNQEYPMPETILVTLSTDTAVSIIERGVKSEDFINFLTVDVMPYVEKHYRTQPFKILVSGKRFGQAPLYAMMHHPDLFQAYINISPWTRNASDLIKEFEIFLKRRKELNAFLWLSSGGESRVTPHYEQLITALEQHAPKGLDWESTKFENLNDMAQSLVSLPNALVSLFSDRRLSEESEVFKSGGKAIKNYFKEISEHKYGYTVSAERTLNMLGNALLRDKEFKKAIAVFKMNVNDYPDSPHVYAGLARALYINSELEAAVPVQKKAFELAAAQKSEYEDQYRQILARIKDEISTKH